MFDFQNIMHLGWSKKVRNASIGVYRVPFIASSERQSAFRGKIVEHCLFCNLPVDKLKVQKSFVFASNCSDSKSGYFANMPA